MFRAALWSAFIENPHERQTKCDWDFRFALSQYPQTEHVRLVLRASTTATGTPARFALYSMNERS